MGTKDNIFDKSQSTDPIFHLQWLGFFLITRIVPKAGIPDTKIVVEAVPNYNHKAKAVIMMLDRPAGITPRIKKDAVIPISRLTLGSACSFLAQ